MKLGDILRNHARFSPQRPAVVAGPHRLSYRAFNDRVDRLAAALAARGLRPGDRVACVSPNCLELLAIYWATASLGVVAVPLSPLLNADALQRLIDHAGASFAFLSDEADAQLSPDGAFSPSVPIDRRIVLGGDAASERSYDRFVDTAAPTPPEPSIDGNAAAMIVYSSGTTGEPKGITLSHRVRAMYGLLFGAAFRMTPESVALHTGSLVFNGAFMTLMPAFHLGSTYILHKAFDPLAIIDTIEREQVTHMVLVPSQIQALLDHPAFDPRRLASLEALISLGAALHLPVKQRLLDLLGERFYEMYGVAEGFVTILDRFQARGKLASVGTPPPFFEIRIVDADGRDLPPGEAGEILGRGPIMMDGYYNRPDLTARAIDDGWLRSGDIGMLDADGYLYLADRKKDMIKTGGVSVYPSDIEATMLRHPAVREAAVFAIPHAKWGETPVAAVLLHKNADITSDALQTWTNAHVSARFQRIADLVIVDHMPRNAAGKTLKAALRTQYLSEQSAG